MRAIIDKAKLVKLFENNGKMTEFSSFFAALKLPKNHKYMNISLQKIELICQSINKQLYTNIDDIQSSDQKSSWKKGQYKLFVLVSAYYCFINEISIENTKKQDFDYLRSIFLTKSTQRMRYQIRNICSLNKKLRKKWNFDQILELRNIIQNYQNQNKKLQWKAISFNLFLQSKGSYFKTFSQCREMWINHLDLSICKEDWTKEEDQILLQQASKNKSWARITQKLGGNRSKNMVRNRYNALVRAGIQQTKQMHMNSHKQRDVRLNQKLDLNVDLQAKQERKIDDLSQMEMQVYANQIRSVNQKFHLQNQAYNLERLSPLYLLINEDKLLDLKNYACNQKQLNFIPEKPQLQIFNPNSIQLCFVGDFDKEEIILNNLE